MGGYLRVISSASLSRSAMTAFGTLAMKQNEDSSAVNELRAELASVRDEISALREQLEADVVYLRDSNVRPFSLRGAS